MRKVKVDFTNVESYGKCAEGIHTAKIVDIEETTSQAGDDMLKITFEVVSGESKGCKLFDNCVLTEKALWKFQLLLKALGMRCEGKLAIDLDKLIGKLVDVEVSHEEYNGQTRARVNDFTKAGTKSSAGMDDDIDDEDEDEEVEEKPTKAEKKPVSKAKKAAKKPEPEEDEDDEDWDDEEDEEDDEPEETPAKSKKPTKPAEKSKKTTSKSTKSAPAKSAKKKSEPEEEEDWEEDDEDWEDDDE